MAIKALIFLTISSLFFASAFAEISIIQQNQEDEVVSGNSTPVEGLVHNFYKDSCPQAEDIIREQVKLLYKRHKNTAFSWLRNIFHDCAVEVISLN